MTSQATETTGNENAVASLFATISRLSPQYHVLANANSDQVESVLDRSRRSLSRFNPDTARREDLHDFIDRFQLELNTLGNVIVSTWFMPRVDTSGKG